MVTTYLRGRRLNLSANALIGKGGEADVYRLDATTVLKRYKEPSDPDYAGDRLAQQGAQARLLQQQSKLPAFPKGLPEQVIAPIDLAYDQAHAGGIVGYTMRFLDGMEVLLRYGDRQYREQGGIDGNQVLEIFRNLRELVERIHAQQVVIGDFNDLNVLVDGKNQTYLVDADSMQFGGYACQTYTTRFLDPLLSETDRLTLVRPHNVSSDWYAYLVMLCQSLLYAGPYTGVHRPPHGRRLQHDERVLRRMTVFDPNVLYPKPALPLSALPDDLLDYLHKVFERDERGAFPERLLAMRWTTCRACGFSHARTTCPACSAPGAVVQTVVVRGTVTATRVFRTSGRLLHVAYQNGTLRYLYHEGASFLREGGVEVLKGTLDPLLRFRIQGSRTLIGKQDKLFVLSAGGSPVRLTTDTFRNLSMFDATERHQYWIENGTLVHDGAYGSEYIGDVLSRQTMVWAGNGFGFGFYQAGAITRSFVFDAQKRGLNDQVAVPHLAGQLVDATTVFGDNQAWFMTTSQESGKLVNRCYVIDRKGTVLAAASADAGDDSWLGGGIRGRLAVGKALYAATDEGIVRLGIANGSVEVERSFPDTEPFVGDHTQLVASPEGIYAVSPTEIVLLKIQ